MFWILLRLYLFHQALLARDRGAKIHPSILDILMYSQVNDNKSRRAQDPRLIRADPRVRSQNRVDQPLTSPSPSNISQGAQNDTIYQITSDIPSTFQQDTTAPYASEGVQLPSSDILKPLFCVVCASNQVCVLP